MSLPPILVTGAPRSGTTWVGKMLASHPNVGYIDEPLNLHEGGPSKYMFQHVCGADEERYADYLRRRIHQVKPRRALLKDPMALMAAEWVVKTFGARVVVTIRHPAAFISSIKVLDWPHPWEHFLEQPELVRTRLKKFETDMQLLAARPHDLIENGQLVWRICHQVIRNYQVEHPDWIFVRHEDLSLDPLGGFARIFERIGLDYTKECRQCVKAHSLDPADSADLSREGRIYDIRRNSARNLENWKARLTAGELDRIRDSFEDFRHFYPEPIWSF